MSTGTNTRIDGPLVYLESPGPEHLPAIWKVYLDAPDYFEALTGTADFDPTAVEMMFEEALSEDNRYYLAIRRTDTKSLIGTIEFEAGADEVPATLRGLVVAQGERGKASSRTSWGSPRSRPRFRWATTTALGFLRRWATGSAGSSPASSAG